MKEGHLARGWVVCRYLENGYNQRMVKPEIKSFLMADQVIREADTNKWSAIGIFSKILCHAFPTMYPSMALYFNLANVQEGDYDLKIEFSDGNGIVLATFEGIKLTVHDRLSPVEIGIQTRLLPLPSAGKYDFRLYFNQQFVQSLPLTVEKIDLPGFPT